MSISTARAAPQYIATDLKRAMKVDDNCYANSKTERLESYPQIKNFHNPIKLNKLRTFSNLSKQREIKNNGRSVIPQADKAIFSRIIVMAQNRNLYMAEVLSHPLGPLPWALVIPEGIFAENKQNYSGHSLQNNFTPAEKKMPDNSATIIDGMFLIQKVADDQANFVEVAMCVLSMAKKDQGMSQKISERLARDEELGLELKNITVA